MITLIARRDLVHRGRKIAAGEAFTVSTSTALVLRFDGDADVAPAEYQAPRSDAPHRRRYRRRDLNAER